MKTYILSLLFACLSFSAFAQHTSEPDATESKFFVGIGLSNTQYPIMGGDKQESFSAIIPIANINYGYRLNKRTTIQLGIGYGANTIKGSGTSSVSGGMVGIYRSYQHIRGVVTPLTLKWTPFNPYKRLQLYANASLAPIFGHMKASATETYEEETTLLYDESFYTFDLTATFGLTLNYKVSKRLDVYMDAILLNKNLYFQRASTSFFTQASAGIGLNYNFSLKKAN